MPSLMRRSYTQLPAHTYTGWNNLGDVHATLRELEFGRFRNAAIMVDQMMRDDRFSAVIDTRIDALGSVPVMVRPGNETDQAQALADYLGGVEDLPAAWGMQFAPEVLGELLMWGVTLNFGLAEILYNTSEPAPRELVEAGLFKKGDTIWTPSLKLWHPQFVRWDWGTQRFKVMTAEGEVDLPRLDEDPRGDGRWVVYCPRGYHQAWMKGAVRSMAVSVLERGLNRKYWGRFNEKYGLPTDVVKAPASAPKEMKDAVFEMFAGRGGETVVMLESTKSAEPEAPGEEWGYEIAEVKGGTAWKTYESRQNMLNTDIAVKVLGQNLTTEVGSAGSKAAEQGHNDIRIEKLKKDAGLADVMYHQVLIPVAKANYDDTTLAPRPYFQADPPEDLGERATTMQALAGALAAFETASIPVDVRATLEEFDVAAMTPEEEAAHRAMKAEEAANAVALTQQKTAALKGPPAEGDDAPADDRKMRGGPLPGMSGVVKTVDFAGMKLAIETPVGTHRLWTAPDGSTGSTKMTSDYGYIVGHNLSGDKEQLDCYLGTATDSTWVFNVHQKLAPDYKRWDEDKVMLGFASEGDAKAAYLAHRDDGDRAYGGMSSMPLDVFTGKLKRRTGTGKIRAGAASAADMGATTGALVALAGRAHREIAAAARHPTPKRLAAAEQLHRAAVQMGARALAPYLAKVKASITGASSPQEVEQRLASVFKNEDPAAFAEVMKRTRILGHLAGDASVMKQIGKGKK